MGGWSHLFTFTKLKHFSPYPRISKQTQTMNNLPAFYNRYYSKSIVVRVTDKCEFANWIKTSTHDEEIKMSVELQDFDGRPDCKVGSFSANVWFRTPHGTHIKAYDSEAQLERSVRLCLSKRGLQFVRWEKNTTNSMQETINHIASM